jgi:hypothetical protein
MRFSGKGAAQDKPNKGYTEYAITFKMVKSIKANRLDSLGEFGLVQIFPYRVQICP